MVDVAFKVAMLLALACGAEMTATLRAAVSRATIAFVDLANVKPLPLLSAVLLTGHPPYVDTKSGEGRRSTYASQFELCESPRIVGNPYAPLGIEP